MGSTAQGARAGAGGSQELDHANDRCPSRVGQLGPPRLPERTLSPSLARRRNASDCHGGGSLAISTRMQDDAAYGRPASLSEVHARNRCLVVYLQYIRGRIAAFGLHGALILSGQWSVALPMLFNGCLCPRAVVPQLVRFSNLLPRWAWVTRAPRPSFIGLPVPPCSSKTMMNSKGRPLLGCGWACHQQPAFRNFLRFCTTTVRPRGVRLSCRCSADGLR